MSPALYPGDVIFTGTPAGVGVGRNPPLFLQPGDRLDTWIESIGDLHQSFVTAPDYHFLAKPPTATF
ncbi:fumarylacetoacetate hydrolase family protein [Pseudarthrobacter sp. S9]|uniref:fumarylacetoacetate hydrolase family protein n=1 Tax=Pseudarthrobacter sp. S9 TaxID=3418421 RepID=UPI003D072D04